MMHAHAMTPATTQAASGARRRPCPPLPTIPESCAAASPDEPPSPAEVNRQILGERLHALIQVEQGWLAGKITGILLESLDNSELVALIDDRDALESWIQALVGAASRLRHEGWVRERKRDMASVAWIYAHFLLLTNLPFHQLPLHRSNQCVEGLLPRPHAPSFTRLLRDSAVIKYPASAAVLLPTPAAPRKPALSPLYPPPVASE
jgi:hypothetical protein